MLARCATDEVLWLVLWFLRQGDSGGHWHILQKSANFEVKGFPTVANQEVAKLDTTVRRAVHLAGWAEGWRGPFFSRLLTYSVTKYQAGYVRHRCTRLFAFALGVLSSSFSPQLLRCRMASPSSIALSSTKMVLSPGSSAKMINS